MYIGTQMALLKKAQKREVLIDEMQNLLNTCKEEQRNFTDTENANFEKLEKQIDELDKELQKHDTNLEDLTNRMEERNRKYEAIKNPEKHQKKQDNQVE